MATFHGRDGVVEVDDDAVLKLQSWSYNETIATHEADAMGDTWMTRVSGLKDASGDIVYFEDDSDTDNGQTSIEVGTEVTLKLYSQGSGDGAQYRTGPAIISEIGHPVAKGDMVTVTASWVANGAWTKETVSA